MNSRREDTAFLTGLARAFAGALIFSLPLLMTNEMWDFGHTAGSFRIALLMVFTFPLLVGLSHYMGFEPTFGIKDDVVDSFAALAVGFTLPAIFLLLLSLIEPGMSAREVVGKICLQAVPASIGAMFARSELGMPRNELGRKASHAGYGGELFTMAAGALFLGFNVAPTEEVAVIAYQSPPWNFVLLALLSCAMMHVFVYAAGFSGQHDIPAGEAFWGVFFRYTLVGYSLTLMISFYLLWTFGRTDDTAIFQQVQMTIVLGLPSALGAAAARLIL